METAIRTFREPYISPMRELSATETAVPRVVALKNHPTSAAVKFVSAMIDVTKGPYIDP
jgi:hypothetical protein